MAEYGDALLRLYQAFSRYERPRNFEACGCCWSGNQIASEGWRGTTRPVVLVDSPGGAAPLTTVPAGDLAHLANDLLLTGGDLDVFKHYLPRLLELAADQAFPDEDPDIAIVFERLSFDSDIGSEPWWTWPPDEREAVHDYLWALWRHRTATATDPELLDGTVCALGNAVPDIQPFLDHWSNAVDEVASTNLEAFLTLNANALVRRRLVNDF